jgi:hypothetical protein
MRVFLKVLPYLLVVVLGICIFFGFRYMSNQLSQANAEKQCLIDEKNALTAELDGLKEQNAITINQLEQLQKNEKESLNNVLTSSAEIDNINLSGDKAELLKKINEHEKCVATNSLKPTVKCTMEL